MTEEHERVPCPSSSVTLQCPGCPTQIECEIKIWAWGFTEGDQPKVSVHAEVDDQPMWDHALFYHTDLVE